MRFVGVDLAWGGRRPSGLAVPDAGGRVVVEGWVTTDEELSGFLAGHDRGGAVVALDAPLVVNPAGTRRGCEAELQRGSGRWRPSSAGWAGPTRRCGSTRRESWPGSWAGWRSCGARG